MDLQKASMWKRICAYILDTMLMVCLAVGAGVVLSAVTDYDTHNANLNAYYDQYEARYGVDFEISVEEYEALKEKPGAKENWDAAYEALIADEAVLDVYEVVARLSIAITALGILFSVLVLEFVVPLIFGNGQTVGKKLFSVGVMRIDSVKVNTMQMFVRTLIGKYTIEIMVPIFMVLMFIFGAMDITGTIIIIGILLTQVIMMIATKNNSTIHDMLSGTVVIDISSQRIYNSSEELLEHTKKIHAERARRQTY